MVMVEFPVEVGDYGYLVAVVYESNGTIPSGGMAQWS